MAGTRLPRGGGALRLFTQKVAQRIVEIALSPPRKLIGTRRWILASLREYLIEQSIVQNISLEWLRQILHREGVNWPRAKRRRRKTAFVDLKRHDNGVGPETPPPGKTVDRQWSQRPMTWSRGPFDASWFPVA